MGVGETRKERASERASSLSSLPPSWMATDLHGVVNILLSSQAVVALAEIRDLERHFAPAASAAREKRGSACHARARSAEHSHLRPCSFRTGLAKVKGPLPAQLGGLSRVGVWLFKRGNATLELPASRHKRLEAARGGEIVCSCVCRCLLAPAFSLGHPPHDPGPRAGWQQGLWPLSRSLSDCTTVDGQCAGSLRLRGAA